MLDFTAESVLTFKIMKKLHNVFFYGGWLPLLIKVTYMDNSSQVEVRVWENKYCAKKIKVTTIQRRLKCVFGYLVS